MTCKTFTPHPYQQYCINRIVSDPTVGLFLDMGCEPCSGGGPEKGSRGHLAERSINVDTDKGFAGGRGAWHGGSSAARIGYTG